MQKPPSDVHTDVGRYTLLECIEYVRICGSRIAYVMLTQTKDCILYEQGKWRGDFTSLVACIVISRSELLPQASTCGHHRAADRQRVDSSVQDPKHIKENAER